MKLLRGVQLVVRLNGMEVELKGLSKFISDLNEKRKEIKLYKRLADSIKKQDLEGVRNTLEKGGQNMALKLGEVLDNFIKDQTEKILYKQLISAIEAQDLEGVQKALKDGASAAYLPENDIKRNIETPLSYALDSGNVPIFDTLLNSKDGGKALSYGHDFRIHYGRHGLHAMQSKENFDTNSPKSKFDVIMQSQPPHLCAAIEAGHKRIALLLALHSKVDVENSGEVSLLPHFIIDGEVRLPLVLSPISPLDEVIKRAKKDGDYDVVDSIKKDKEEIRCTESQIAADSLPPFLSPLELAKEKGMGFVVAAIEERIKSQNVSEKKQPTPTMAL